jgi:undecaprenyl-diphosphatase
MTLAQIIIYGIVQGITELFPISSVGHAVILPYLAGWTSISSNSQFLPFVVMLHLGTALALLIYFWRDWVDLLSSLFMNKPKQRRLLFLIIVATIPAAIVGKLFEHKFRELFPSALSAAIFLIVNGFVLLLADRLRRRSQTVSIERVSYGQSFLIGLVQVLALIPGFSRSGITMTAGLGVGLSYEESARFSFLLATPVILGAGILEVPKAWHAHATQIFHYGLIGGLITAIIAYLSTFFLMRYFKNHEIRALRPFAYYCMIVGVIVAFFAATGAHL